MRSPALRPSSSRRPLLALGLVLALLAATVASIAPAAAQNQGVSLQNPNVSVELTPFARIPDASTGRARINAMTTIDDRLFVVEERDGRIYELIRTVDGAAAVLFFDMGAALRANGRVLDDNNIGQSGLRGLAFHPEFAENGLFYTSLMETRVGGLPANQYLSDVSNPMVADSVVIEWRANVATGTVAASTYRQVFRVGVPIYDHVMKQIAFNPFAEPGDEDYGLLYAAHGDSDFQSASSGGGQNNDARGKILRVDPRPSAGRSYTIPPTNPFVGDPSMHNAVFSLGHRNPHHLAFAQDSSGEVHLISADIGRNNFEEINLITAGSNYGWGLREGTVVHRPSIQALPANEAVNGFTFPAAQYAHTGSGLQGVAGGFVTNNGSELDGQFFYTDFPIRGTLFSSTVDELARAVTELDPNVANRDSPGDLTQAPTRSVQVLFDHDADHATPPLARNSLADVFNDSPFYDGSGRADTRFGQGPDGELYVTSKRNGQIYLISNSVPATGLCEGRLPTVSGTRGTQGSDVIIGTQRGDVINGLGGADTICGLDGNDRINAGAGADLVFAGRGADVVNGGAGADTIFGQFGRDLLEGGRGDDVLVGGDGPDRLVGLSGADRLLAGPGNDRVWGGDGRDVLSGGTGDDQLRGGAGTDRAIGGGGNDLCLTESSRDC